MKGKVKRKMMKNRKAISPVIATVILVAVAITIAVAVSYWMSGIAGQYTKFEKVEIQSGYAELQPTPGGWIVTLELKNSGSAAANLIKVFVNDKPVDLYGATFALTQADRLVAAEAIAVGTTDKKVYNGNLANANIKPGTMIVTAVSGTDTVTLTDVLVPGTLTGPIGNSGTINYLTGAYSITFAAHPTTSISIAYTYFGTKTGTNIPDTGVAIDSGKTANVGGTTPSTPVQVFIGSGLFSSGTTVDIKIHSAGGMDYIKLIQLV